MKKLILLFLTLLSFQGFSQSFGTINSQQNNASTVVSTLYNGLIVNYNFNESSGTTLIDDGVNGLDGTIYGADLAQPGLIDTAHLMLNVDSTVVADNDLLTIVDDSLTVSVWIYITNLVNDIYICGKTYEWRLYVSAGGQLNFRIFNSPAYIGRITDYDIIQENTWYHIVVTHDGTLNRSGIKIDVNNIREDTGNLGTSTIVQINNMTSSMYIGYSKSENSRFFQGYLDQFLIWDRILTTAEKLELNNLTRGKKL